MTLEAYLSVIGQVATGVIWTALCMMLVMVACVYGYKTGMSLVKNADINIAKIKRVKLFKAQPLKVVERTVERKQKKATA
jgi:mannose/fructose/N-acetylgalactosamine-specific phosphotransferase system component IID